MKALVSALALLSFVAATTIPYVAHAQTTQSTPKSKKKVTKKAVHKKVTPKKVSKKKPVKKPAA